MDVFTDILQPAERVPLRLRALYERYGYSRFRMGRFEPYDLYAENRQFLGSEGIITFTDARGRLMALKPDVTISIVKNTPPDTVSQKLYYNENVFRTERGFGEYREINQIGLEHIGAGGGYAEAEILLLALGSLAEISGDYVLNLSHMGFISAMMDSLGLEGGYRPRLLFALKQKNTGEILALAEKLGLSERQRRALTGVFGICRELGAGIEAAREFVLCGGMSEALYELEELYGILRAGGYSGGAVLDFSVVNDIDYYNGLVFRGYVKNAPRAVLAGGRYDNLMRRFGKPQRAVGFAIYLSELERMLHHTHEYDADVLLIYGGVSDRLAAQAARGLLEGGESVRAELGPVPGIRVKRVLKLLESGDMEAVCDA